MADDDKPKKFDADKFKDEYNRRALFSEFPSKDLWAEVTGCGFRRTDDGRHLVALSGRNQQGETLKMWTDLPNAMYMLAQLLQVQERLNAPLVLEQPPPAKGNPN